MRSIVLRKVSGILTPLMRPVTGSFGGGATPQTITAGLLSPLMLVLLAVAFAVAWALAHGGFAAPASHGLTAFALVGSVAEIEKQIKQRGDQIDAKSAKLNEVFEKAGTDVDFNKAEVHAVVGAKSAAEVIEKVRAMQAELETIASDRDRLLKAKRDAETPVNAPAQPGDDQPAKTKAREFKSMGEIVMQSPAMKRYRETGSPHTSIVEDFGLDELKMYGPNGQKATFVTTAGWAPETTRTGLVVPAVTRPIQLLDIIPTGPTGQAAVKYMEETTLTHASAERAENASYAESSFALTERSETVRSIGASVPVTDEQLEDVPGAQTYLEGRLVFGNMQRMDGQILVGSGVAPNLTGIKNKAGINTQAKGTDPIADAIYKGARVARVTGRSNPNAVVFHPTDWEKVRLLRDANGNYIWGSPALPGPQTIWGLTVVLCDADSAGSAYVGDFAGYCQLYERRGMEVAVGYVNNDFLQGRKTIRAGLRVAFAIYRAAAFTQVTGL